MPFGDFSFLDYIVDIIDVLIVSYVIYKLIMIIRGTKAVQLLKGIFVIIGVWFLSGILGLSTLQRLMNEALTWGFLAVIIIFQPEVRRALEQLGRGKLFSRSGIPEEVEMSNTIEEITKAISYMAKRRIGALLSIEQNTGMGDYIETGIPIYGKVSSELLINIFIPNTPLHDGAVIMKEHEIKAAACYLPLSESPFISKELGTRHRAALGIAEVTDCITIVVSEETGQISLTRNGELHRDLDKDTLTNMLTGLLIDQSKVASSSRWNWRVKRSE